MENNDMEAIQHFLRIYFVPVTVLHTSKVLTPLVFVRQRYHQAPFHK